MSFDFGLTLLIIGVVGVSIIIGALAYEEYQNEIKFTELDTLDCKTILSNIMKLHYKHDIRLHEKATELLDKCYEGVVEIRHTEHQKITEGYEIYDKTKYKLYYVEHFWADGKEVGKGTLVVVEK